MGSVFSERRETKKQMQAGTNAAQGKKRKHLAWMGLPTRERKGAERFLKEGRGRALRTQRPGGRGLEKIQRELGERKGGSSEEGNPEHLLRKGERQFVTKKIRKAGRGRSKFPIEAQLVDALGARALSIKPKRRG